MSSNEVTPEMLKRLSEIRHLVEEANKKTIETIMKAEAVLIDMKPAIKAIPGFKENMILHSGPPIEWKRMSKVQKVAIINTIMAEGLADTPERAEKLVETGEIILAPNHAFKNVSGMCGVTSPSCPVFVFRNPVHGNEAYSWMQTDLTAFGIKFEKGIDEWKFVVNVLGPVLGEAIRSSKGINIKEMMALALQRGDDLHSIHYAANGIFITWLLPYLIEIGFDKQTVKAVAKFFNEKTHTAQWFAGNLVLGACKVMMDAARNIKYSTVVVAMSRNGVEFGIQVSGLGDRWFTGPAGRIKGFLFPGYSEEDAALDIGDSAITETRGVGAFALASSPSQARLVGGLQKAVELVNMMRQITLAEDPYFKIPYMNYIGVPVGIDIRKVLATGIVPRIITGIAHKEGGYSLIGVGISEAPIQAFKKALLAFAKEYGK